jgi:glutathione synthase
LKKIAFLIDPIENLKPESDSSLKLIAEASARGYDVYTCQPEDLFIENNKAFAILKHIQHRKESLIMNLSEFHMIFIRQDPPFNLNYITCTYILELLKDKVRIINNPTSLRNCPEKLFPLSFPDFIPQTMITSSVNVAEHFIAKFKQVVLKPIYSYGGNDVCVVDSRNWKERFLYLVTKYQEKLIMQEFIPEVAHGDKRVLMVNGEIVATILRKPEQGSILANLGQGGTAHRAQLTTKEMIICTTVGKQLIEKDIIFAGLDLINEHLIEINITSPTCIIPANNLYNIKIEKLIFDALTT